MILTAEQIQVIRRDVEAYLANNRKLKPTSLDAETMLQLLDTVDAQDDIIKSLARTSTQSLIERDTLRVQLAHAEFLNSRFAQDIAGEATEASFHKTEFHTPDPPPVSHSGEIFKYNQPFLPASPPQAQVPEPYVDQEHNVVVDPALAPTMEEMPVSDFVTGETISRAEYNKKCLQDLPTDETF